MKALHRPISTMIVVFAVVALLVYVGIKVQVNLKLKAVRRNAWEIAMATERYAVDHDGEYPPIVDDSLLTHFLRKVPINPYSGKPTQNRLPWEGQPGDFAYVPIIHVPLPSDRGPALKYIARMLFFFAPGGRYHVERSDFQLDPEGKVYISDSRLFSAPDSTRPIIHRNGEKQGIYCYFPIGDDISHFHLPLCPRP